ncbi:nucleoside monophosphate kinase [Candidatus Sumerlaeota bacterium]|nr:nucleoside monophosphate kinase [Candidatus Sumerlaeota bacterium]
MNIVMMGIQGSGKGTQSKLLSRHLDIPHISVGELFRDHINRGTELGKKAEQYVNKGELVPDHIVIDMVLSALGSPDARAGFVLDGFPRNKVQLTAMEESRPAEYAILLELDEQTALRRLAHRLECPKCHIIYGKNIPPRREGICDVCGSPLVQRDDDQEVDAIKRRMNLFHQESKEIIQYYERKGVLKRIDASLSESEVFQQIIRSLGI